ncbi:MAG: sulfatase-like hydrolase/transferase, partial [Planctomycetota bacterium]
CDFMEQNRDQPFFLYVAHHATHMGIQARPDMFEKFDEKGPAELHKNTRFAAMNAQMDDGVGLLLDKLKDLGLEENTLVVFTSDNGALPQSPPTPLRGFKGMYYEGGVRVPMIARWPGVVEAGSRCNTPVINIDFYPTFLALADTAGNDPAGNDPAATVPQPLDGANLTPLLTGGVLDREAIFWHFPGYLNSPNPGSRDNVFRARPETTIRKGDWKLHLYHEEWLLDGGAEKIASNRCVELYNLADDIAERHDLANDFPAKRDELLGDILAWHKQIAAPMPRPLADTGR